MSAQAASASPIDIVAVRIVLHAPAFQRFVNLWLGKGGIGAKHHFAQLLLPLNLGAAETLPSPRRCAGCRDTALPPGNRRLG